ncbi:MAG: Hpt domain-containing protein [Pseudomonadota bacterium]
MTEMPSIDTLHLERSTMGDPLLMDEVLDLFCDYIASFRDRLDAEASDEAWYDVMHALKGSARGVGAFGLARACEEGEKLVGEDPEKTASRSYKLKLITGLIEEAIAEAQQLRSTNASG